MATTVPADSQPTPKKIINDDGSVNLSVLPAYQELVAQGRLDALPAAEKTSFINTLISKVKNSFSQAAASQTPVSQTSTAINTAYTLNSPNSLTLNAVAEMRNVMDGSAANETLNGSTLDDILSGDFGNDTLKGGAGNDLYLYSKGDGSDILIDTAGNDTLKFKNLTVSDVEFIKQSNNLVIKIKGTTDKITINNWSAAKTNHIESIKFSDNKVLTDAAVDNLAAVNSYAQNQYRNLLNTYLAKSGTAGYIQDPSQGNQIVSEGQSNWQLLSTRMAMTDQSNSVAYQSDFDSLLAGSEQLATLAKATGSTGVFPGWKAKLVSGVISLDSAAGSANSAADADIDYIRSLIAAQKLVEAGVWADKGYGAKAKTLIASATSGAKSLFTTEGGVLVPRPSEDWDGYHYTDYLNPAGYKEIAQFAGKQGMASTTVNFWNKAAADSMLLYGAVLRDMGEFAGKVQFAISSPSDIKVTRVLDSVQSNDGFRAPMRIGEYLLNWAETDGDYATALAAYKAGINKQFTYNEEVDKALYYPLSAALGDQKSIDKLLPMITAQTINPSNYYEQSLILLGLTSTAQPAFQNITAAHQLPLAQTGLYAGKKSTVLTDTLTALGIKISWMNDLPYVHCYEALADLLSGRTKPLGNLALGARIYDLNQKSGMALKDAYTKGFLEENMGIAYNDGYYYLGQPLWTNSNDQLSQCLNQQGYAKIFDQLQSIAVISPTLNDNLLTAGVTGFYAKELDPRYADIAQRLLNLKTAQNLDLSGLDFGRVYKTILNGLTGIPAASQSAQIDTMLGQIARTNSMETQLSALKMTGFKSLVTADPTYDPRFYAMADQIIKGITTPFATGVSFNAAVQFLNNPDGFVTALKSPLFVRALNVNLTGEEKALGDTTQTSRLSSVVSRLEAIKSTTLIGSMPINFATVNSNISNGYSTDAAILYSYMQTNNINVQNAGQAIQFDKSVDLMSEAEIKTNLNTVGITTDVWYASYISIGRSLLKLFEGRLKPNLPTTVPIDWINGGGATVEIAYITKAKDRNWSYLHYPVDQQDALNQLNQIAPKITPANSISNYATLNPLIATQFATLLRRAWVNYQLKANQVTGYDMTLADTSQLSTAEKMAVALTGTATDQANAKTVIANTPALATLAPVFTASGKTFAQFATDLTVIWNKIAPIMTNNPALAIPTQLSYTANQTALLNTIAAMSVANQKAITLNFATLTGLWDKITGCTTTVLNIPKKTVYSANELALIDTLAALTPAQRTALTTSFATLIQMWNGADTSRTAAIIPPKKTDYTLKEKTLIPKLAAMTAANRNLIKVSYDGLLAMENQALLPSALTLNMAKVLGNTSDYQAIINAYTTYKGTGTATFSAFCDAEVTLWNKENSLETAKIIIPDKLTFTANETAVINKLTAITAAQRTGLTVSWDNLVQLQNEGALPATLDARTLRLLSTPFAFTDVYNTYKASGQTLSTYASTITTVWDKVNAVMATNPVLAIPTQLQYSTNEQTLITSIYQLPVANRNNMKQTFTQLRDLWNKISTFSRTDIPQDLIYTSSQVSVIDKLYALSSADQQQVSISYPTLVKYEGYGYLPNLPAKLDNAAVAALLKLGEATLDKMAANKIPVDVTNKMVQYYLSSQPTILPDKLYGDYISSARDNNTIKNFTDFVKTYYIYESSNQGLSQTDYLNWGGDTGYTARQLQVLDTLSNLDPILKPFVGFSENDLCTTTENLDWIANPGSFIVSQKPGYPLTDPSTISDPSIKLQHQQLQLALASYLKHGGTFDATLPGASYSKLFSTMTTRGISTATDLSRMLQFMGTPFSLSNLSANAVATDTGNNVTFTLNTAYNLGAKTDIAIINPASDVVDNLYQGQITANTVNLNWDLKTTLTATPTGSGISRTVVGDGDYLLFSKYALDARQVNKLDFENLEKSNPDLKLTLKGNPGQSFNQTNIMAALMEAKYIDNDGNILPKFNMTAPANFSLGMSGTTDASRISSINSTIRDILTQCDGIVKCGFDYSTSKTDVNANYLKSKITITNKVISGSGQLQTASITGSKGQIVERNDLTYLTELTRTGGAYDKVRVIDGAIKFSPAMKMPKSDADAGKVLHVDDKYIYTVEGVGESTYVYDDSGDGGHYVNYYLSKPTNTYMWRPWHDGGTSGIDEYFLKNFHNDGSVDFDLKQDYGWADYIGPVNLKEDCNTFYLRTYIKGDWASYIGLKLDQPIVYQYDKNDLSIKTPITDNIQLGQLLYENTKPANSLTLGGYQYWVDRGYQNKVRMTRKNTTTGIEEFCYLKDPAANLIDTTAQDFFLYKNDAQKLGVAFVDKTLSGYTTKTITQDISTTTWIPSSLLNTTADLAVKLNLSMGSDTWQTTINNPEIKLIKTLDTLISGNIKSAPMNFSDLYSDYASLINPINFNNSLASRYLNTRDTLKETLTNMVTDSIYSSMKAASPNAPDSDLRTNAANEITSKDYITKILNALETNHYLSGGIRSIPTESIVSTFTADPENPNELHLNDTTMQALPYYNHTLEKNIFTLLKNACTENQITPVQEVLVKDYMMNNKGNYFYNGAAMTTTAQRDAIINQYGLKTMWEIVVGNNRAGYGKDPLAPPDIPQNRNEYGYKTAITDLNIDYLGQNILSLTRQYDSAASRYQTGFLGVNKENDLIRNYAVSDDPIGLAPLEFSNPTYGFGQGWDMTLDSTALISAIDQTAQGQSQSIRSVSVMLGGNQISFTYNENSAGETIALEPVDPNSPYKATLLNNGSTLKLLDGSGTQYLYDYTVMNDSTQNKTIQDYWLNNVFQGWGNDDKKIMDLNIEHKALKLTSVTRTDGVKLTYHYDNLNHTESGNQSVQNGDDWINNLIGSAAFLINRTESPDALKGITDTLGVGSGSLGLMFVNFIDLAKGASDPNPDRAKASIDAIKKMLLDIGVNKVKSELTRSALNALSQKLAETFADKAGQAALFAQIQGAINIIFLIYEVVSFLTSLSSVYTKKEKSTTYDKTRLASISIDKDNTRLNDISFGYRNSYAGDARATQLAFIDNLNASTQVSERVDYDYDNNNYLTEVTRTLNPKTRISDTHITPGSQEETRYKEYTYAYQHFTQATVDKLDDKTGNPMDTYYLLSNITNERNDNTTNVQYDFNDIADVTNTQLDSRVIAALNKPMTDGQITLEQIQNTCNITRGAADAILRELETNGALVMIPENLTITSATIKSIFISDDVFNKYKTQLKDLFVENITTMTTRPSLLTLRTDVTRNTLNQAANGMYALDGNTFSDAAINILRYITDQGSDYSEFLYSPYAGKVSATYNPRLPLYLSSDYRAYQDVLSNLVESNHVTNLNGGANARYYPMAKEQDAYSGYIVRNIIQTDGITQDQSTTQYTYKDYGPFTPYFSDQKGKNYGFLSVETSTLQTDGDTGARQLLSGSTHYVQGMVKTTAQGELNSSSMNLLGITSTQQTALWNALTGAAGLAQSSGTVTALDFAELDLHFSTGDLTPQAIIDKLKSSNMINAAGTIQAAFTPNDPLFDLRFSDGVTDAADKLAWDNLENIVVDIMKSKIKTVFNTTTTAANIATWSPAGITPALSAAQLDLVRNWLLNAYNLNQSTENTNDYHDRHLLATWSDNNGNISRTTFKDYLYNTPETVITTDLESSQTVNRTDIFPAFESYRNSLQLIFSNAATTDTAPQLMFRDHVDTYRARSILGTTADPNLIKILGTALNSGKTQSITTTPALDGSLHDLPLDESAISNVLTTYGSTRIALLNLLENSGLIQKRLNPASNNTAYYSTFKADTTTDPTTLLFSALPDFTLSRDVILGTTGSPSKLQVNNPNTNSDTPLDPLVIQQALQLFINTYCTTTGTTCTLKPALAYKPYTANKPDFVAQDAYPRLSLKDASQTEIAYIDGSAIKTFIQGIIDEYKKSILTLLQKSHLTTTEQTLQTNNLTNLTESTLKTVNGILSDLNYSQYTAAGLLSSTTTRQSLSGTTGFEESQLLQKNNTQNIAYQYTPGSTDVSGMTGNLLSQGMTYTLVSPNATNPLQFDDTPNGHYRKVTQQESVDQTTGINTDNTLSKTAGTVLYSSYQIYDLTTGLIAQEKDQSGLVKTYTYDQQHRLVRIDYNDNTFESWSYMDKATPVMGKDINGLITGLNNPALTPATQTSGTLVGQLGDQIYNALLTNTTCRYLDEWGHVGADTTSKSNLKAVTRPAAFLQEISVTGQDLTSLKNNIWTLLRQRNNLSSTHTDRTGLATTSTYDGSGHEIFVDNAGALADIARQYDSSGNLTREITYTGTWAGWSNLATTATFTKLTDQQSQFDATGRMTRTQNEKGETQDVAYAANGVVKIQYNKGAADSYSTETKTDTLGAMEYAKTYNASGVLLHQATMTTGKDNAITGINFTTGTGESNLDRTLSYNPDGSIRGDQSIDGAHEASIQGVGFEQIRKGVNSAVSEDTVLLKDGLARITTMKIKNGAASAYTNWRTFAYDQKITSVFGDTTTSAATGQLTTATAINNPTSTTPVTVSAQYRYDVNGNVTERQNTYNEKTSAIKYNYVKVNQMSQATLKGNTTATKTQNWDYDSLNRLQKIRFTVNGVEKTINIDYTADGKIKTIAYPTDSAMYSNYGYDSSTGNLTEIKIARTNNLSDTNYLRDLIYNYTTGKITGKNDRIAGGVTLTNESYQRDAEGNLIKILNNLNSNLTQYNYDANYSLSGIATGAATVSGSTWNFSGTTSNDTFAMEANSTRLDKLTTANNTVVDVNYDLGTLRPNTVAELAMTYDNAGNLSKWGGNTYYIDADNRRIASVNGTTTTYNLYDEQDRLIGECDSTGKLSSMYILGPGNLILGKISGIGGTETVTYYANDYQGNNVLQTNNGATVSNNAYDIWGKPSAVSGADHTYIYTGKLWEDYTTLTGSKLSGGYNLGRRIYLPELKRFISDDALNPTLSNFKSYNAYTYANNDPVNYVDPTGNDAILLNDSKAVFGLGHNATLVGNDSYGWYYFSKNGFLGNISSNTIYKFDNLNSFFQSDLSRRYDNAFLVKTNPMQDRGMLNYGQLFYLKDYKLGGENCADLSYGILNAGGIKINEPSLFGNTVPNWQFENFIKLNQDYGYSIDLLTNPED